MKNIIKSISQMLVVITMAILFTVQGTQAVKAATSLDSLMNQYVGTTWNGNYYGVQCKGFANLMFFKLWGVKNIGPYNSSKYYIPSPSGAYEVGRINFSNMSVENAKNLLLKGKQGDFIQVRRRNKSYGHSMILVGTNQDGIKVFDCNSDGKNGVRYYSITWQQFYNNNSAMSLYRANSNASSQAESGANHDPIGYLDVAIGGTQEISVGGWVMDPDNKNQSTYIDIYLNGPAGSGAPGYRIKCDKYRQDIEQVYGNGNHGYAEVIKTDLTGQVTLYAYAINIDGTSGENPLIATRTVTVYGKSASPKGCVDDLLAVGNGSIRVRGWTFEEGFAGTTQIHVYADGRFVGSAFANNLRTDVYNAYGMGMYSGFDATIQIGLGCHRIEVYAISQDEKNNVLLKSETLDVY